MSNFDFLHPDWPEFLDDAKAMEKLVRFDPISACGRARNLVEQVVLWMYENDEDLEMPFDTTLYNITNQVPFKKIIGYTIYEKIRKAKPLTDKDVETLEKFLLESDPGISREEFHELVGEEMELITFVRSVSGLERKAVMHQFQEFLQDKRLSSNQIQFIEQMIEFYTQKGHLDVAHLYEPPFNFIDEDGIDGVFDGESTVIDMLVRKVRDLNEIRVG